MKTLGIWIFAMMAAGAVSAADYSDYVTLAETSSARMDQTHAGNIDAAIQEQTRLLALGRANAEAFGRDFPEYAEMMAFVSESGPKMTTMTLEAIEAAWHEGSALEDAGFLNTTIDHFGVLNSIVDMVVHPATAIIALRQYKASGDQAFLEQVKDEMAEVVEHIHQL